VTAASKHLAIVCLEARKN